MRIFFGPIVAAAAVLMAARYWGGAEAFLLVATLAVLEVSLSFDNAVINAKVLGKMSPRWQRAFLLWGMPVAVFGVRFVLPILIVAAAAWSSPWRIALLAFQDPFEYAELLYGAAPAIHAFGGAFLLMVALQYFFDETKTVHWLGGFERRLAKWGRINLIEVLLGLIVVLWVGLAFMPTEQVLYAGLAGIVLYILISAFTTILTSIFRNGSGFALFIYLNVLDAAFSLDGVVGAFALTTDVFVILAGLGIGAYFVRAFTVYLTQRGTLSAFKYLEHGAHWAIFSLAVFLFAGLFTSVPQVIPGTVGLVFAVLSFLSSLKARRSGR